LAAAPPAASIISEETSVASRSALQALSSLVIRPEVAGSDTLEGLVSEMLRPMLKEWLDARLPEIVEALVAKEVARIAGRGL
jgi:cell pole-organizing protein PopZ